MKVLITTELNENNSLCICIYDFYQIHVCVCHLTDIAVRRSNCYLLVWLNISLSCSTLGSGIATEFSEL